MTTKTTDAFPFGQQIVWQPNPKWIAESNLQRFMDRHGIKSYDDLWQKSIIDIQWFWEAVLEDLDIQFYEPYTTLLDLRSDVAFLQWCVGGKMNIIHNCLDKWQTTSVRNRIALRWEGENGDTQHLTYQDLHQAVCQCANGLRQLGIGKGDVVGLYMPMIPELLIAFLAIIKIGGIILPLFSGYGAGAIAIRLKDAHAKALFTVDSTQRRGKVVHMKQVAEQALQQSPMVKHLIVVSSHKSAHTTLTKDRDITWQQLMQDQSYQADTEKTSAEDVLMIIYTSGTTGKPKGAVHTHCGFPIKAAQDMYQAMDVKSTDTMYWMSDMGWMMGPWEVFGTLLIGATMVFYDGAPDYPDHHRLWRLVEKHQITYLGISPTLIRTLKSYGIESLQKYDLSSLRAIGSTGSPWDPESWLWTFQHVLNEEKPILNYSGGTEISGGIVCGNFFKPLKPCAFSGPVVGMDAKVFNDQGEPVRGEVGELVIKQPWIGMTRGFWQDNERYLDSYWRHFEGVWRHGDFAAIDEDGLWYILGRSDDTIKVAGKRLGPAEVEAILNAHSAVLESAAIGVPHPIKDNEVVAFCVLKPDTTPTENLRQELLNLIVEKLGKPLKPKEIKFITALPKTRNAKVMRRVIRAVYLNEEHGDMSSLENPTTVDAIRQAT